MAMVAVLSDSYFNNRPRRLQRALARRAAIKQLRLPFLKLRTAQLTSWSKPVHFPMITIPHKGVNKEPMDPAQRAVWDKIQQLAARFQRADRTLWPICDAHLEPEGYLFGCVFATSHCIAAANDAGINRRCYNENPILCSCAAHEYGSALANRDQKVAPCERDLGSLARVAFGIEVLALTEKFNGDLRWRFLDRLFNLFGGVGQSVRVDIYSYATTRTGHAPLRF
jgi:hypothetical protein